MKKRLLAGLCALLLTPAFALADLTWPDAATQGQVLLQDYVQRVNANLAQQGRGAINSVFECYTGFAVLGVTALDGAESPEGIELTFSLHQDSLNTLQLRVSRIDQFAALAASCIQAASPTAVTLQDALTEPEARAAQAVKEPGNSFEDAVIELNGEAPRAYYAYYPDQYHDGVNWLQLTLVFPLAQAGEALAVITPEPSQSIVTYYTDDSGDVVGYEYQQFDGKTHLEVFVTSTPEPDSAAGDEMNR